ncbi:MAG: sulfatase-like hydrolase/transferase, partial [Polyangiaceae bacterium]
MSRRHVLEAGVAGAATLATGCGGGDRELDDPTPGRILLITADDLGWRDLSSLGNPNLSTPHLDRLRSGGVSFTRAFDVTSTCASSRTTYATGQYPHTHGVVGLVHRLPELSLPENVDTLAKVLRAAGYLTAIEGKFHLAFPQTPEPYGYDDVMTTLITQWIQNTDKTLDFIRRRRDERWFFELNYMNPHRNALGEFRQHPDHPIDPATLVIPEYIRLPDVPGAREELAAYYSQIERMDAMIGEVLETLEDLGQLDDTLVVFISDNGSPFPGNKLTLYDRGTGTPWFFHWPRMLARDVERTELVSSVDLMPTIA